MRRNFGIIILMSLLLVACNTRSYDSGSNNQQGSSAAIGTGLGALAGGLIGNKLGSKKNRTAATLAGTFIGGIIGNNIGRNLDNMDRQAGSQAEYYALERGRSGSKYDWDNPDSGHRGYVVPGQAYDNGGDVCRTYTHTVYIDGKPRLMKGRACRNNDGSWSAI